MSFDMQKPTDPSSKRHRAQDYLDLLPIRTVRHLIKIDNVDFLNHSFTVFSEMLVQAQKEGLRTISLNLGKDVTILNQGKEPGVSINGIPAEYTFNDVSKIESTKPIKSLKDFRNAIETQNVDFNAKLIIQIPQGLENAVGNLFTIKSSVRVSKPKNGVHFHVDKKNDGSLGPRCHCYTYRTSIESNSSDWIPCFDDILQFSSFEIFIRIPDHFTAQASGEHIDTIDEDDNLSLYHFRVDTPTAISNIGFAIGCFDNFVHPDMPTVMFLALDDYMPIVKHTVANIPRVFSFFEELMSSPFPFPSFHLFFVYRIPDNFVAYNGIALFPVEVLYGKKNIELVLSSRKYIANAIASQFFGCFVQPLRYNDIWLTTALARFLTILYVERDFGFCEYIYEIDQLMKDVCAYEKRFGKICLNPQNNDDISESYGNQTCPNLTSPQHFEMSVRKGLLVLRMIHNHLGKESFMKVLRSLLSVATKNGFYNKRQELWYYMTVSADSFFETVTKVTGQDLSFLTKHWINGGGHAYFDVSYNLDQKRNVIEFTVKQTPERGRRIYTGPLTIAVQELNGPFNHTLYIDSAEFRKDVPCHTKTRNKKKRTVMIAIGEEVEMDFTNLDQNAKILWIRVDPDMCLIRECYIVQSLTHFQYMLQYERDISAQLDAIDVFKMSFVAGQTIEALNTCLLDDRLFYHVRIHAVKALAFARSKFTSSTINAKSMIEIFKGFYGSKSYPSIVKLNNVVVVSSSLQMWAIQKPFTKALGTVRDQTGHCPVEHVKFISDLIFYNNNSQNRFNDDFLRAAYVEAIGLTITQSEKDTPTIENRSETVQLIMENITLSLNEDILKPSFHRVVRIAGLRAICNLQRFGHIPINLSFFWLYTDTSSNCNLVRVAAIMCIVKLIKAKSETNWFVDEMAKVIDFILRDPEAQFVYEALKQLGENLLFHIGDDNESKRISLPRKSQKLFSTILGYMVDLNVQPRARLLLFDLLYVFYGTTEPDFFSEQ